VNQPEAGAVLDAEQAGCRSAGRSSCVSVLSGSPGCEQSQSVSGGRAGFRGVDGEGESGIERVHLFHLASVAEGTSALLRPSKRQAPTQTASCSSPRSPPPPASGPTCAATLSTRLGADQADRAPRRPATRAPDAGVARYQRRPPSTDQRCLLVPPATRTPHPAVHDERFRDALLGALARQTGVPLAKGREAKCRPPSLPTSVTWRASRPAALGPVCSDSQRAALRRLVPAAVVRFSAEFA
jgi:hypothetical protein